MSRAKSRQNFEICSDCGAMDATWTSLNRGIFLCTQCCSIHRSLGRHISQIKSVHKSDLTPTQLSMLYTLHNSGVNNIWEHTLLEKESKHKRKPSPKDSISVKAEFIRAKHQNLQFVFRPNNEDGLLCVENELGKQLHSSVRTGNLETSFRLLIQGADPNFFHDEKGTTPLHVAAKANQKEQAELLILYGADPTFPDVNGATPVDYAKQHANKDLYNRLVENQYEVTDKFSFYLCLRKPDHANGAHYIIPQTVNKSNSLFSLKLQKLPNHVFEELAMDLYDEIDRRDIELIWCSNADTLELSSVPFLPVDPTLSTTRNQSRQKLGRFSTPDLKLLVHDMLIDAHRRQMLSEKSYKNSQGFSSGNGIIDDDPLYDSVASDDDYAVINPKTEEECNNKTSPSKNTDENDNPTAQSTSPNKCTPIREDIELLARKLLESNSTIDELKNEVSNLKALVEHLSNENYDLKSKLSQATSDSKKVNGLSGQSSLDSSIMIIAEDPKLQLTNGKVEGNDSDIELRAPKKIQRPTSMYETREGLRTPNWQTLKSQLRQNDSRSTFDAPSVSYSKEQIIAYTEEITKSIQEFWNRIQDKGRENSASYAGKISFAVHNLVKALPSENNSQTVRHILECVHYLHSNCIGLQNAQSEGNEQQIDQYIQKVRKCAYEIAKDTKQLVTKYTSQ